ncbi:hypothetical protein [Pseudonocardia acidicola]|uniref:Uncharacterized protein n=1 Tax=Pseudonocardia acidicola TaxID=2724939 RepID=A0ABX1SCH2_9PSEU|nr:hypothetical protein [Pseudonocardia acidicola]NMH99261.1 hypothetical protein [Pseudonocardia acidicola]
MIVLDSSPTLLAGEERRSMDADGRGTLGVVRCALVALSALGILGVVAEIGAPGRLQTVPWVGVGLLAVATVLLVLPRRAKLLPLVRILALLVLGAAAFGVAEHLLAHPDPAGFDHQIGTYWASLSPLTRSWYGGGAAGAATPLAPGMLGQAALLLLLATTGAGSRFPRLRRSER